MPDTDKQLHTGEPFVVVSPEIAQTWGYNKKGLNGYYGVQQNNGLLEKELNNDRARQEAYG